MNDHKSLRLKSEYLWNLNITGHVPPSNKKLNLKYLLLHIKARSFLQVSSLSCNSAILLLSNMTSIQWKLVAGDQFSFSSNSLPASEPVEDFGLAFGDWTGSHCNDCIGSDIHNEPEWPTKKEPLSPTSQAQAIARYKKDMLELVGDAPEYVYELSFTDLVELPMIVKLSRESPARQRFLKNKKAVRKSSRSESMETGGFLLKMFFPIPLTEKKRSSGRNRDRSKPVSRSSSSGSSDGRKPGPGTCKSSEEKYVDLQQQGVLSRNCSSSMQQKGCYSFLLAQNKSRTRKILY